MPAQTPQLDSYLQKHLSKSKYTVLGHTHHSFSWCNGEKYLINPGSVGQPRDKASLASYFILDLINEVLLPGRVKFPIENLLKMIKKNDPKNHYLKSVLTRGTK